MKNGETMFARTPSRRTGGRPPALAWAAVSVLALLSFVIEIDIGPSRAPLDATHVVPALK